MEFESPNPAGTVAVNEPRQGPNGHWYQLVSAPEGLNWSQAKTAAEAMRFKGLKGQLASITDAAEQKFIAEQILSALAQVADQRYVDAAWLGGSRRKETADPKSGWSWTTGEPMQFSHWWPGQPDDTNDAEYLLQIVGDGTWNDVGDLSPTPNYLVEFEP